jgi:hypothetical protein
MSPPFASFSAGEIVQAPATGHVVELSSLHEPVLPAGAQVSPWKMVESLPALYTIEMSWHTDILHTDAQQTTHTPRPRPAPGHVPS